MTVVAPPHDFRMPAEWELHHATWIAWPHNRTDWPGKFLPIPWVYVEIVRHLHKGERVCILVDDEVLLKRASYSLLRGGVDLDQIDFYRFPTDRIWTRDFGPIFIKSNKKQVPEVAVTHWKFNGWAKYSDWKKDHRIPRKIATALGMRIWEPRFPWKSGGRSIVLEGGSIDVNGQGTLMTTEECLLSPIQQRNPSLGREELEQVFRAYLGVQKVLWLKRGIAGDDTHGHVDDLARFVGPSTIVTVVENNPQEINYDPLQENFELLKTMVDQDGRRLEVVPLPMPKPLTFAGQRLPASYANLYIANTVVLVPTFNDPADRVALSILSELFPDREVIGIHSVDLVWGLGTVHCLTQQQPHV